MASTASTTSRSPLALLRFPTMPAIAGVELATAAAGIRQRGRRDVLLVSLAPGTNVAGVFTQSKTASAAVRWCQDHIGAGRARGLVVNSGNANAFSGAAGEEAVRRTSAAAAHALGCRPAGVFVASTGVIGEPLPWPRMVAVLAKLGGRLRPGGWAKAAAAISTTDTFAKGATRTATIGGARVTINGIAKGAGMIAPDLATMLAFLFTDARVPAPVLQRLVRTGAARSFNAITVDSDTSTSDTVLAFATGKSPRHPRITSAADPRLADFKAKLREVMTSLAHQIVRDGEGASKFVTIHVSGAESARAARRIGFSIANSPLVKTAIAGSDPNWGRIVMAVGKAGEAADRDRLAITFGPHPVAAGGVIHPDYDEAALAAYMKGDEIEIGVDVGVGQGRFTVWTCDLTHEYIRINADYRS